MAKGMASRTVHGCRRKLTTISALVAAGAVLCGATLTYAAPRISVIVRGVGAGSDKAAGIAANYVHEVFRQDERYEWVDLGVVLGDPAHQRAQIAFKEAEELVKKGRAAYEEFELDKASKVLKDALVRYQRHAGHLSSYERLAEVHMLLGAIYSLEGQQKKATSSMQYAYSAFPGIQPDPRLYNPSMRELFEWSVKELRRNSSGSVAVTSTPSYARVYVDGSFRGVTPALVTKLGPGPHQLKLLKDGFRHFGRIVRVKAGREAEESVTLKPTNHFDNFDNLTSAAIESVEGVRQDDLPDSLPQAIEELGSFLDSDVLLLMAVRLDGDRVRIQASQVDLNATLPQEQWPATGSQVFAYDSSIDVYQRELAILFEGHFSAEAMAKKVKESPSGGVAKKVGEASPCWGMRCGTFKSVTTWSLAGVGAALAGTGSAFWLMAQSDHDQYRGESAPYQSSSEAAELRSSGESAALMGDIMMTTGVVALVGSAALALFWEPGPGVDQALSETSGSWGFDLMPTVDGASFILRTEF